MSANVLFGAYVPADTPIHRLDARVKLVALLGLTASVFATRQPMALVAMAASVLACARLGATGWKSLVAALGPTALIMAFVLTANTIVLDGSGDIALAGISCISSAGLARGALAVSRLVILVAASLVLCATTTSTQLAEALESLLAPLGRLGVPTADIAMVISVALRFIPLTAQELLRIRDAQRARGADFGSGGPLVRVRRWLCVLVPLVVALFRRADELAAAMRERCYTGRGRTRLARPLRRADIVVLAAALAACACACLC